MRGTVCYYFVVRVSVGSRFTQSSTLIGAIDQGTSSSRFLLFDTTTGRLVGKHQVHCACAWAEKRPCSPFVMITVTASLNPKITHVHFDRSVTNVSTTGLGRTRSKCTAVNGGRLYRRSVPSAARRWIQCGASERCRHFESTRFAATYPHAGASSAESIVMWDANTGECLADCVVWLDARTADLAQQFIERTPTKDKMHFRCARAHHVCE